MSFPSKEDLDALLQSAQEPPYDAPMLVRSDWLAYLIENLRRVNNEIVTLAYRMDELRAEHKKQLRRAKKWKRRYTALENKRHEARQDPTE